MLRLSGAAALVLVLLAGCSRKDDIADRVEQKADARADAMEQASKTMTNALARDNVRAQAKLTRDAGKDKARAIRTSPLKPEHLTDAQRNALINAEEPPGNGTQQRALNHR